MPSGPVVIGFDGTPLSERVVVEAAGLLAPRRAVVVTVWEAGLALDLAQNPAAALDFPATTLDIRTAVELDKAMYEEATRTARWGATLAVENGLEAEGLVVADEVSIPDTLVRVADELDAEALVVGARPRGKLGELLLGSTARDVLRHAKRPVVTVPEHRD